jgi:flagellar biosynthetic protein FlhB
MAETEGQEDRTEAPTQRRLEQAREEGRVAISREATGFCALLLATVGAVLALPAAMERMMRAGRGVLAGAHELPLSDTLQELALLGLLAVLPVAAGAALGAVAGTLLQSRGLVSAALLAPRFSKLNPWAGLKRMFGPETGAELLRNLVKLGLIGTVLWLALADWQGLARALLLAPMGLLAEAGEGARHLLLAALAMLAPIVLADLLWANWRHLRQLRMTRQDLKQEVRESEGDPHIRSRLRRLREQRARRRMMAAVPRAAVVITNPTHYAVALAYDAAAGGGAPRVVAKGVDAMAARIRAAAEASRVPLVANPPLARALHRLELESEIPPEHYQAVAEIIAYVWRLRRAVPQAWDG